MPEIPYKEIGGHLKACKDAEFPPVYLIYGEKFLVDRVAAGIIKALLPDEKSRDIYMETVSPPDSFGIYDSIERLNTLSFFSGKKVVRLKGDGMFASGFQPAKTIEKIKESVDQGDEKKAIDLFLILAGKQQSRIEDFVSEDIATALQIDPKSSGDLEFIRDVARKCLDRGLVPGPAEDAAGALKNAIENGFPKNHYLLVVTDAADRRTALFKTISAQGAVVNCTVPRGARKADRDEQRGVLSRLMQQMLSRNKKTAEDGVFDRVFDLTGFDPRAFSANVDKLVHYSGTSGRITVEDVRKVLDRSREDPIYALTGAISERNAGLALYYLSSLLDSGYHYMQLLAAISNQVRRLLLVKDFVDASKGAWQPGMRFDLFKKQTMPAIVDFDKRLMDHIAEHSAGETKKKGSNQATDLLIAKNPKNPYPIYQMFLQSDRFSGESLSNAMIKLADTDIRLKTTGQNPKAVLESAIFEICR